LLVFVFFFAFLLFLLNKEAMDVAFSGLKKCCMEIRVYPFWLLAPSILVVRATSLQCESDGDNTCQDLRGLCCMVILLHDVSRPYKLQLQDSSCQRLCRLGIWKCRIWSICISGHLLVTNSVFFFVVVNFFQNTKRKN
jgi:hypothetical protein